MKSINEVVSFGFPLIKVAVLDPTLVENLVVKLLIYAKQLTKYLERNIKE